MRLLLCEPGDLSALWALQALRATGLEIELVTSEELARARRWEHRIEGGRAWTEVELADGRGIDSRSVSATLNRLVRATTAGLAGADPADRDYAAAELWAFWMSWLESLPGPVLNRPSPQGLCGPWLHGTQWLVLAAGAGLATPPCRSTNGAEPLAFEPLAGQPFLVVAGGAVVGPSAPDEVVQGCRELSRAVPCDLLGVWFRNDWELAGASPLPDLRRGGPALVDVLAAALE